VKRLLLALTCIALCSIARAKDYFLYHTYINTAESYLVNDVPDSVYHYYDRAFTEYDFVFAKDAYIAAQFAWLHKNQQKTISYLLKGAGSGLRSACLETNNILTSFTNTSSYMDVYTGMRSANAVFNASLDMELRKEWTSRMDEMLLNRGELADYLSGLRGNMARVKELAAKGKFPGEIMIGLDDNCDNLSNHNVFYSLANYDCVMTEMHDQLCTAVKNGQLHPREFARLWEWEHVRSARDGKLVTKKVLGYVIAGLVMIYLKDNAYVETNSNCMRDLKKVRSFRLLLDVPDVSTEEINANRSKYYITSLEVDEKKRKLEAAQGYRFFYENK
jgi:hypothetical protein